MARRRGERGHAEVGDLDPPVARDEHVSGLDVEVQHAVAVRELERVGHGPDHGGGLVGVERSAHAVEQDVERAAVDELHDEERLVGVGVEVVDGHDRGVVEHRGGAGLGEAGRVVEYAAAGVERQREALDGDAALHAGVPREDDGAVAALAELGEGAVAVEDELLLHAPPDLAVARSRRQRFILAEQPA